MLIGLTSGFTGDEVTAGVMVELVMTGLAVLLESLLPRGGEARGVTVVV